MTPFGAATRRFRARHVSHSRDTSYPGSLVRIIDDGDDFVSALERAIGFERTAVEALTDRVNRYEQMNPRVTIIQMPEQSVANNLSPENEADSA